MKNTQVKIGSLVFNSYKEYETAYVKKWYEIHPIDSICDLNWVQKDWEIRLSKQKM